MRKQFLDVVFDDISGKKRCELVDSWLTKGGRYTIVTPGPEFVVRAWKEPLFKALLREANLSVCDGVGVQLFSLLTGNYIAHRAPGIDVMYDLCGIAETKKKSIFLVGAKNGHAHSAAQKLQEKFPHLTIAGAFDGPEVRERKNQMRIHVHNPEEEKKILDAITHTQPSFIFVALGAGKQEKWMYNHLQSLPKNCIIMGVGGAFDMIAGSLPRAPHIVRAFGFEWLWRLLQEPWRWRRILTATVGLSVLSIERLFNKLKPARRNVLAVVVNNKNQFLLINNRYIERAYGEPHWQCVQGGIDGGESAQDATVRELEEETGAPRHTYTLIAQSAIKHSYELPLSAPHSRKVFTIFYARFTGTNHDLHPTEESSNFKWVPLDELVESLHMLRRSVGREIVAELQSPFGDAILK